MQIPENRNDKRYAILAAMLLRINTFLDVTFCSGVNISLRSERSMWDCWTLEDEETIAGKRSSSNTVPHPEKT
jgi:hypothetical protein